MIWDFFSRPYIIIKGPTFNIQENIVLLRHLKSLCNFFFYQVPLYVSIFFGGGRKIILFNLPTDRVIEITKGVAWIQFQGMQRLCESEMLFCYQNCSDLLGEKKFLISDREKLLKFEAEGRDIHIECSKQFKWNSYFYVSGQIWNLSRLTHI